MNMDDSSKDLIPTKDETMEILSQVSQAQMEKPDLMAVPVATIQAWTDCVVRKAFNRVKGEYGKASDEFMDEVKRSSEQFGNEVDKTFARFQNEIEKAIKRFEGKANL